MEITMVKTEKDGQKKKDSLQKMSLSDSLVKMVKPKDENCIQEPFLQSISSLDRRIPKNVVSFDEKNLRRCLELIYVSAATAGLCNIPESLGSLHMGKLSDRSSSLKIKSRYPCDLTKFSFDCEMEGRSGDAIGTITESKSMRNISKSSSIHQIGSLEKEFDYGRMSLTRVVKSLSSGFMSSPSWLSSSSSQKLGKKARILENETSTTNSTFSDKSPFSFISPDIITQGMLHCTWKDGLPQYVFSLDDLKEVYVANLFKPKSRDHKMFDYMYIFHTNESNLVGKMRVSTTFTLCPKNSEIKETEYVLFGTDHVSSVEDTHTSSLILKKKKRLSKKMVDVFKTSHPTREKTSSKCVGMSTILENIDNHFPPNLELASIIVKDHNCGSSQRAEIGGWGLNFLKKAKSRQVIASVEDLCSQCCLRDSSDCSTSVDIVVPAGFHGEPINTNGGPSSLIERWRSSGHCDCGGWDVGCALTILNTKPSKREVLPQEDTQGDCKSVDLFRQGSMQSAPVIKMVNIRDGLYFIHFQSSLSALQSFSIAVAIIHAQSVLELKL